MWISSRLERITVRSAGSTRADTGVGYVTGSGMLATVHDHLTVRGSIAIPRRELSWRFSRSSGPGGQSVNTADSRVELRWDLAASSALPPPLKERALARLAGRLVDGAIVVTAQES